MHLYAVQTDCQTLAELYAELYAELFAELYVDSVQKLFMGDKRLEWKQLFAVASPSRCR